MTTICYFNIVLLLCTAVFAQNEWQSRDAFLEVRLKMDKVTAENCHTLDSKDLYLPNDVVSHVIDIQLLNIDPVYLNRTAMLHLHNMALSRSFFWSYILQSRFIRPASDETHDPGMMYYFLSTIADVTANPFINASAIYFAPNSAYTPTYRNFFNKTMLRFAPRTYRLDDSNEPIQSFDVEDLGTIPAKSAPKDYTDESYGINEWYQSWLPDIPESRFETKTTYLADIHYANDTNEKFIFHGPNGADVVPGPVKFTRPYFDCGRTNKWLIAAVVPIVDIYPRHTQVIPRHTQKYRAIHEFYPLKKT